MSHSALIGSARAHSLGDMLRRAAQREPAKTAIVYRDRRLTYAELDSRVNRVAHALGDRGIGKGDRLAILSHNNDAFIVTSFAVARLGAILVPINFMLKAQEVAYVLRHSQPSGLIVEDALAPVALDALQAVGLALCARGVIRDHGGAMPEGWEDVASWTCHADDREPLVTVADDDPAQILYTSGTESRPKGAVLSTRNLMAQYISCIVDGDMSAGDIEIHALPLYHCAQLHCFLSPGIYLGATNLVLPRADAAAMLAAIESEQITKLFCPPTVWISLLRHPDFNRRNLSSLRKGYYGASAMPVQIIEELSERLPQMRLFNFYGQTEMSPLATVLKPEDQVRKIGSAGRPTLNVETRIVDDEDRPVPPGVVGEVVHRGPHVMLGYWNDPGKTAEVFRGGWFHSGDLGRMDEEGYLWIIDRKKDMIKTGGENVASREVEEVVYRHPAVAEVAVVATPDTRWIEAVTAVVVLRAGASVTEGELVAHCRAHLAEFKAPKRIVFVSHLPRNASGKVLKSELRASLADRQG